LGSLLKLLFSMSVFYSQMYVAKVANAATNSPMLPRS
jgi:hypothetical protein